MVKNISELVSVVMDKEFREWSKTGYREMISEQHIKMEGLDVYGERKFLVGDCPLDEIYDHVIRPADHMIEAINCHPDRVDVIVNSPWGESWDCVIVTRVTIIFRKSCGYDPAYVREDI